MRQGRDKTLATAELELRILLLPPILRGAHLGGPKLHAQRLVELWKVGGTDDVPLSMAFRLLDADAIAGAILRTVAAKDYPGDARFWTFPDLTDFLPELYDLCWQAMLDGTLSVEAVKGLHSKRHRAVTPVELPRLRPDWQLSRLCLDERDELVDARVRRAPAEPVQKRWRKRPSREKLKAAMDEIAKAYSPDANPPPVENPPTEETVWAELKACLGPDVTRQDTRDALKDYPLLRRPSGRPRKPTPS